jgi:hypothetical protein
VSTVRCTCKHENDAWRRYCAQCAAELIPACGGCGFANRASDKFCGGCARPTGAVRAAKAGATPLPRVPRPPVLPSAPKGSIKAQTAARVADRMHNKTTVPIDRFDVVSETTDQQ